MIWQFYLYGNDTDEMLERGRQMLAGNAAYGWYYGVIGSDGQRLTVDGGHAAAEWRMSDRKCDPGEWVLLWEDYVTAPDAAAAALVVKKALADGSALDKLRVVRI